MPLYDFKCGTCKKVIEVITKKLYVDAPICEKCEIEMTRIYSVFGVIFNGPGFNKNESN